MTTIGAHVFRHGASIFQWWVERWDDRCIDCGKTRRNAIHQGVPAWTPEDVANLTRRVQRLDAKR